MTDAPSRIPDFDPAARAGRRSGAGIRRMRRAVGDRSGAAAIEFAVVSAMLVFTIVFVMLAGLILYIEQALNYATVKASRQIMTGYVQKNGVSQSDFRTKILCPYLPAQMVCDNVIVNVQTLDEGSQPNGYYQFVDSRSGLNIPALSNAGARYDPGMPTYFVYVQVIYPITLLPRFMAALLGAATFNGSPAYLATSTAAFRNEQY